MSKKKKNHAARTVVHMVRGLHHWTTNSANRLVCASCLEPDGCGGGEAVLWPCATAIIVWDIETVKEVMYWHRIWERWMRDVAYRKRMAGAWGMWDDMRLRSRYMLRQQQHANIVDRLLRLDPAPAGGLVIYEVKK